MLVHTETVIAAKWRQHCQRRKDLALSIFKLLAHPDATPEQIAQVRESALNSEQQHRDLRGKLMAKYPHVNWREYETR